MKAADKFTIDRHEFIVKERENLVAALAAKEDDSKRLEKAQPTDKVLMDRIRCKDDVTVLQGKIKVLDDEVKQMTPALQLIWDQQVKDQEAEQDKVDTKTLNALIVKREELEKQLNAAWKMEHVERERQRIRNQNRTARKGVSDWRNPNQTSSGFVAPGR